MKIKSLVKNAEHKIKEQNAPSDSNLQKRLHKKRRKEIQNYYQSIIDDIKQDELAIRKLQNKLKEKIFWCKLFLCNSKPI